MRAILVLLLLLLTTCAEGATTIYVSPSGSGDGSLYSPASIASAKALAASAVTSGDVTVYLRGGTYTLTSPLSFGASDSGTGTVTWAAYPGETPVISGAITITGWSQVGSTGIWQASVPAGTKTRQLFVNGQRVQRSYMSGTLLANVTTSNGGATYTGTGMPTFSRPQDLEFQGNNYLFTHQLMSVTSASQAGGTATFTMQANYANAFGPWPAHPVRVENAYEFLSSSTPGCWYLNTATNTLYYVPRAGEDMSTADVKLPVLENLVTFSSASKMNFSGITFAHTTWMLPSTQGYFYPTTCAIYDPTGASYDGSYKGGYFPAAAVSVSASTGVNFNNCTFAHMGGQGVWYGEGSRNGSVTNSTIYDIAANGIAIGGTLSLNPSAKTGAITINNNAIHACALDYWSSVGVIIGVSDNMQVTHNEIYDLPYSGISWGWGLNGPGFTSGYANSNTVAFNKVHDVCLTVSDGGGIYVQGTQGGPITGQTFASNTAYNSSVHDNYIYNVGTPATPNNTIHAIYLDSGAAFMSAYNNVISVGASGAIGQWFTMNFAAGDANMTLNTASGNYADSRTTSIGGPSAARTYISSPTAITGTDPTGWPTAAQSIAAASGPTVVAAPTAAVYRDTMRANFFR